MQYALRLVLAAIGLALLQSCSTEINGNSHYRTGFEKGRTYVVRQDLNGRVDTDTLLRYVRNITLLKTPVVPPYKTATEELVVIPKGTRVLVTTLELTHNIESGTQMEFRAEFASGSYFGKTVVLSEVSKAAKLESGGIFSWLMVRDPEFIGEETTTNQSQ